jgi:uncharacterized membrane protein YecN with MAPEG domain
VIHVTPLYAAASGVMLVAFGGYVARLRGQLHVGLGDGGAKILQRAVRVHGNFAEFVPTALLLMLMAELEGAPPFVLHALGGSLVLARVAHAAGLYRSSGNSPGRFFGVALTWTMIVGNAAVCVYYALAS